MGLYAPVAVCALELGREVLEAGNHAGPVTALIGELVRHLLVPTLVFGPGAPPVDFARLDRTWGKPSAKLRHLGSVRTVQSLAASYVRNARMLSGAGVGRGQRLGVMAREAHTMLDELSVLSGYHGYALGEVAARDLASLVPRPLSPATLRVGAPTLGANAAGPRLQRLGA